MQLRDKALDPPAMMFDEAYRTGQDVSLRYYHALHRHTRHAPWSSVLKSHHTTAVVPQMGRGKDGFSNP